MYYFMYYIMYHIMYHYVILCIIHCIIAGHACSINDPAQVDIDVYSLLELADKAVKGVPFYPRPIVESLIEGAVAKLNKDLGPLIRFLGERVRI